MELDDRALPITRGRLGIWLAQETAQSGTEWQLWRSIARSCLQRCEDSFISCPLAQRAEWQVF